MQKPDNDVMAPVDLDRSRLKWALFWFACQILCAVRLAWLFHDAGRIDELDERFLSVFVLLNFMFVGSTILFIKSLRSESSIHWKAAITVFSLPALSYWVYLLYNLFLWITKQ